MDLLIGEPLETDVVQWLSSRHSVRFVPELAQDPQEFLDALHNVRGAILPATVALHSQALRRAPHLRAIGRISGGAENIDLDACHRLGVEVVRSPTATAQAEAEFAIGAVLSLLRRVPVLTADGAQVGRELGASVVGLIGMPPAAKAIATMLTGFGCRVVGYDPSLHASDSLWERWRITPLGLRELLEAADAVCVQLRYYSRYRGLLGDRLLPYSRPDQVMVSLTHSGVFDLQSLANALRSGRLAAAWLDSLEPGALEVGEPLHGVENLQITPRLASTTRESRLRSAWSVARRLDELLSMAPTAPRDFRPTSPGVPTDLAGGPGSR